jgi:hypothetical protein
VAEAVGVAAALDGADATADEGEEADDEGAALDVVGTGALDEAGAAAANTTFTTPPPQYWPDFSPVT